MILRVKEIWDDWVIYDEDGFRCGIKDDAPDKVEKVYNDFLKKEQENQKNNIKS